MVDTHKAVFCCLLATSAIMLFEKKKTKRNMWGKKWYLKMNISCDKYLLNELLETDDAIVLSPGKLRKQCDSLSELHRSSGSGIWIGLAQDRDRWWALVNAVMNLRVP
jgi:hypothetical protein